MVRVGWWRGCGQGLETALEHATAQAASAHSSSTTRLEGLQGDLDSARSRLATLKVGSAACALRAAGLPAPPLPDPVPPRHPPFSRRRAD